MGILSQATFPARQGTVANKPAANAVISGTIYIETDFDPGTGSGGGTYRRSTISNGAAWVPIAPPIGPTPTCRISALTKSVANGGSGTVLSLGTVDYCTVGTMDDTANKIRIPWDGIYTLEGSGYYSALSTSGYRAIALLKNGSVLPAATVRVPPPADIHYLTISTNVVLAVDDLIELRGQQNSGSPLDIIDPTLTVTYVGPVS